MISKSSTSILMFIFIDSRCLCNDY
jgi:hypothetical protein